MWKTAVLPLSFKSSRSHAQQPPINLTVLGDIGSSLMSERGYDSDAQYLATPKHSDRMERSPTSRPFPRMELSEVLEQRPELLDSVFRAAAFNDIPESEPGSPFGLRYIPTLCGSLSGARTASNASGISYNNGARPETSPGEGPSTVSAEMQPAATRSLDTLTIVTPNSAANILEPVPIIDIPAGTHSQTLMADWIQFLRTNSRVRGTTSSASLSDHGQHGPDLVVPTRQEPFPSDQSLVEGQPLHLDELRISHVLAPRSISSGTHSGNASITAGRTKTNRYALLTAENSHLLQKTATSAVSGTDSQTLTALHTRDASSFYSRQSSLLSTEALRTRAANATASKSEIQVDGIIPGEKPDSIVKSKFVEQLSPITNDSESPGSPIQELESSPRQVSVGWMTNGRRVGYGYTMVSKPEEAFPTSAPRQTQESIERPSLINADNENIKSTEAGCSIAIDPDSEEPKALIPLEKPIIIVDRRLPPRDPAEGPEEVNDTTESIKEDTSWWKKLKTRPTSIQPRPRKAREDVHHGRKTWVLGRGQGSSILEELSEHPQVEGSNANTSTLPFNGPPVGIPHGYIPSPPTPSRNGRWSWQVSKYKETKRETKRLSNGRQENSDASSGPSFQDCASNGLGRVNSTRSNAQDLASMYQEECLDAMPGAFEGSSWARRA
ncbi:hypothetical protein N7474_008481 [Penicillium riverlandense]|uniref:uncharacterized protein n=1 Tax=Penicillium riverlandense TaxID=1903569 RepID=UPI0025483C52|nr:uncharacterized protein N7474_008481 [Penicillium riverlandense]KAJ5812180.1 hypothetical protein N7474_008481 [Penicillium riverlandense]